MSNVVTQPARLPAADALTVLEEEHRAILAAIDALLLRVEQLGAGDGSVPLDELRTIVCFLRELADEVHHAKEEAVLFPAMYAAGFPRRGGPVAVMLHEHAVGREHVDAMRVALDAGLEGEARAGFAQHARAFASLLRAHIQKEDECLYPMARNAIQGAAWDRLGAELARVTERDAERAARLLASLTPLLG